MDTDQGSNMLSAIQSEVAKNQMLIEEEVQKLKRYKVSVSLLFFNLSYTHCFTKLGEGSLSLPPTCGTTMPSFINLTLPMLANYNQLLSTNE